MFRIAFLLLLAPLFFAIHAEAEDSEWGFNADMNLTGLYFPQEYGTDTNQLLGKFEFDPILRWKYKDSWRLFIRPVFIADPANNSQREKYFADPTEAYIKFQKEVLAIRLGFNTFTWGVTDGYNPVDILNTKVLYDPLHAKKLGAFSLAISEALPLIEYDIVYVPKARQALLPGEHSRWLPREVFVPQTPDNNLILLLPNNLVYNYGDRTVLDNSLDNNFALRLQKTISIFDLSISGFDGVAPYPIIEPQVHGTIIQVSPKIIVQMDPDVILDAKDYRIRQGGFSLVSHQWDFLFKYETSYSQSQGDYINLPGWIHESVAGLEKTFNFTSGTVIGVVQYSWLNTQKANDSNISITEIFRRAWMLGIRAQWHEVWTMNLLGLYDTVHSSHFEEITIGRRFYDTWTASVTADFFNGSIENTLGLYDKNDSVAISLSRSF